jgi:hypothetical protein
VAGLKRSSEALARQAKDKDGELARALLEHAEAKKTLVATVQRLAASALKPTTKKDN